MEYRKKVEADDQSVYYKYDSGMERCRYTIDFVHYGQL